MQKISSIALLVVVLGACAPAPDESSTAECGDRPSAPCVIALAQQAALLVSDPADRVTATLEVATAQFAAGAEAPSAAGVRDAQRLTDSIDAEWPRIKAKVLVQATSATLACVAFGSHGDVRSAVLDIDDVDKVADQLGKLIVAAAQCDDSAQAISDALAMTQTSEMLASYKARTLHELAPIIARNQSLGEAEALLNRIDMGLPYYRAVAGNEVARVAVEQSQSDVTQRLLVAAEQLADAEQDGYFKAGMYREAAATYDSLGVSQMADRLFQQAIEATELAPSTQHKARSLSRVATVLADIEDFALARSVLPASVGTAEQIEDLQFRSWAFYEIAGGAAFSGDFAAASSALERIPESLDFGGNRLLSAAQRDVAWGYAKHGRLREALELAASIETPRERVQALSRIARLLIDPRMHALPRYL